MNLFDIRGKKALVTGAGRGIGLALAKGLAEAGVQVDIIDILPDVDKIAKRELGKEAVGIQADLMNREERREAFERAVTNLKGLDILVNNAGMQYKHEFLSYPDDKWDAILELDLSCAFSFMKLAGAVMKEQGAGKIINVASMNAFLGGTNCPAYAAAKAGLAQLTKSGTNELSRYNININAIAPGFILTELTRHIVEDPAAYEAKTARIPKGRWGQAEDLVGTLLFLSAPASDYVCGAVIPIDGGYLCK